MANWRLLGEWALLFLVSAVIGVAALSHPWSARVDASILDMFAQARLGPPSEEIVLVEIDDRTLDDGGTWPWDRARHARLTDALASARPGAIVYDILFLDEGSSAGDTALAASFARAGNVFLPHSFVQQPNAASGLVPALPIEPLAGAAAGMGHVVLYPDSDGIVRRFDLSLKEQGKTYPHLALATLRQTRGDALRDLGTAQNPIISMHPRGSFRTVSAADVLRGSVPREFLAGKIVLVGATAQGLGDRYAVAAGEGQIMSGVEIQANVFDAIIAGRLVREADRQLTVLWLVLALAALSLAFWKLPPAWGLRAALAIIGLVLGVSVLLLLAAPIWLPLSATLLAILIAYPLWGWRRLAAVSRFLQAEAESFGMRSGQSRAEGFDAVAQQVSLVRGLLGETRETLAFLGTVIDASPDVMLVFDHEGELIMQNACAEALFTQQPELRGTTLEDLHLRLQPGPGGEAAALRFPGGQILLKTEAELAGEHGGTVVALRDVTDFHRIEEAHEETLAFLSRGLGWPQHAILDMVGAPVGSISEADRLEAIAEQATRTLDLAGEAVQMARLDAAGLSLAEVDIALLLRQALDRAAPYALRRNVTFESYLKTGVHFCRLDVATMTRVMDTLIGNAIDNSPEQAQITVEWARIGSDSIQIRVTDRGFGMSPQQAATAFGGPDAPWTAQGIDPAVGLRFVRKVAEKHGGEVFVESAPGKGSSFVIELPCSGSVPANR